MPRPLIEIRTDSRVTLGRDSTPSVRRHKPTYSFDPPRSTLVRRGDGRGTSDRASSRDAQGRDRHAERRGREEEAPSGACRAFQHGARLDGQPLQADCDGDRHPTQGALGPRDLPHYQSSAFSLDNTPLSVLRAILPAETSKNVWDYSEASEVQKLGGLLSKWNASEHAGRDASAAECSLHQLHDRWPDVVD